MVFKNISTDIKQLKSFCSFASEFGTYIENSDLFYSKLVEYGNKIIGKNVINEINKKFA